MVLQSLCIKIYIFVLVKLFQRLIALVMDCSLRSNFFLIACDMLVCKRSSIHLFLIGHSARPELAFSSIRVTWIGLLKFGLVIYLSQDCQGLL